MVVDIYENPLQAVQYPVFRESPTWLQGILLCISLVCRAASVMNECGPHLI